MPVARVVTVTLASFSSAVASWHKRFVLQTYRENSMHRHPRPAPWAPRLFPKMGCELSPWMTWQLIFISLLWGTGMEPSLLTGWGACSALRESKLLKVYHRQKPFCIEGAEIPHPWEPLACMLALEVTGMSVAASIPCQKKGQDPSCPSNLEVQRNKTSPLRAHSPQGTS